jgi:hypothetical protein
MPIQLAPVVIHAPFLVLIVSIILIAQVVLLPIISSQTDASHSALSVTTQIIHQNASLVWPTVRSAAP